MVNYSHIGEVVCCRPAGQGCQTPVKFMLRGWGQPSLGCLVYFRSD